MKQRRIAIINEKGGTGKTTLAVHLAAHWAQSKRRQVLLVDLDTQGHASKSLGVDIAQTPGPTAFEWLTDDEVPLKSVARPTRIDGLWLVPADKRMADFPLRLAASAGQNFRLRERLNQPECQRFDAVFFDSPPSLGLTSRNILSAATHVVMPVALTFLSLDGCAEMARTVEEFRTQNGPNGQPPANGSLEIALVVPTMYRKTQLADEILDKLREHFGSKCSSVVLSLNVSIDEAQSHGRTIWEHAAWSRGAQMLTEISEAVDSATST